MVRYEGELPAGDRREIPMTALTPAATLATEIAAYEALVAGSPMLEKEHLFIGILSLDKALAGEQEHGTETYGLAKEHAAVFTLLEITGLNATVLRRLMRQAAGNSGHPGEERVIHRSPACKKVFSRAAALAAGGPVSCIHLFSAVMENPGAVISGVLAESRKYRAALRKTDVHLPPGAAVRRTSDGTIDLRRELVAGIGKTRELIGMLPESSAEFPLVKKALIHRTINLALLCFDEGDSAGLESAVRDLAGLSGNPEDAVRAIFGSRERDRIRRQLRELEERVEPRGR